MISGLVLLGLLVVAEVVLRIGLDRDFYRDRLASSLSVDRDAVSVGHASTSLFTGVELRDARHEGERSTLEAKRIHLSGPVGPGSLQVDGLGLIPAGPASELLRPGHADRIELQLESLRVEGFHRLDALRGTALRAAQIELSGLEVDVFSDRHLAGRPSPKSLPGEILADLGIPLAIDSVAIENGRIRYRERNPAALTAGNIVFADLSATIAPIRIPGEGRTRVQVAARVNDDVPLVAELDWKLTAPDVDLRARATAGAFDPALLNSMFTEVAGVRVGTGVVDSVWFGFDVLAGMAEGTLEARFHGLEVTAVDHDDESDEKLLPSIFLDVTLRDQNPPPEGPPHVGIIRHRRDPTESIFTFLWYTLRSGIFSIVGLPGSS
jgi:hypothetical protein